MVLSGILMRFELLLSEGLSNFSLYTIEIGQIAFVTAVIALSIAVCVKIIKNKNKKNHNKF